MDKSFESFMTTVGVTQQDLDTAMEQLPDHVDDDGDFYVAESPLHGKGVFASKNVSGNLGTFRSEEGWHTLGRFLNHSATPNCTVILSPVGMEVVGEAGEGEELTVDYFQVRNLLHLEGKVMVADEFCEDIDLVVASAKAAGFDTWKPNKGEVGSSIYDGMGFWGEHAIMLRSLIREARAVVIPNTMFFRSTIVGTEKAYIHSDRESGSHTCIVYLSDHEEASGTAFFRHKPTGLIEMPSFDEMRELGILEELKADMVSRDEDKWEQIGYVEGKKNRALIFHAPLFHSRFPLEGIGSSLEDSRLIWATHFYRINGRGDLY